MMMPELNCGTCKRQVELGCFAKRVRDKPEPGQTLRDCWDRPALMPLEVDGDGSWFACPRQTLRENPHWWNRMMMTYSAYKAGFLPDPGAFSDQSNAAIQALQLIDIVAGECQKELDQARGKGSKGGQKAARKGPPKRL